MLFSKNIFRDGIVVLDNQLSPYFCSHVINKFEASLDMGAGQTSGGINSSMKQSSDLHLSVGEHAENWKKEDNVFSESVTNAITKYYQIQEAKTPGLGDNNGSFDTGYQIQRTTPGGFYNWHHDALDSRRLTFIWYLNDISRGGFTEFIDGTKVRPKAGRMLLFPATAQYRHRGVSPKNDIKYIVTGWLYSQITHDRLVLENSGLLEPQST